MVSSKDSEVQKQGSSPCGAVERKGFRERRHDGAVSVVAFPAVPYKLGEQWTPGKHEAGTKVKGWPSTTLQAREYAMTCHSLQIMAFPVWRYSRHVTKAQPVACQLQAPHA